MRPLTFSGFLKSYVRALAGESTLSLKALAKRSESEPRLVEPLLLWAVAGDRSAQMARLLDEREDLQQELRTLANLKRRGRLEAALESEDPALRPEYAKVWRSYVVRRDAHLRDAQLKLEARRRVLELESGKRVTRYRMAKDLGLNPGNLHAFLAQGNVTKLSLDRAMALVRLLETAA
jgi:hypothetical protein